MMGEGTTRRGAGYGTGPNRPRGTPRDGSASGLTGDGVWTLNRPNTTRRERPRTAVGASIRGDTIE